MKFVVTKEVEESSIEEVLRKENQYSDLLTSRIVQIYEVPDE